MLLELTSKWPFVKRHVCQVHHVHHVHQMKGHSKHGTPDHAHRSWVKTEHGVGWIHHHEADGFVVEFEDHRLLKCKHVSPYEKRK